MIKLRWEVERPKYHRLRVLVDQHDGFHFRLHNTKNIHVVPSGGVHVKFPDLMEAEEFIDNAEAVLRWGKLLAKGCFKYVWLYGRKTEIPYWLEVVSTPKPKQGKVVKLTLLLEENIRNVPDSVSEFEFNARELELLVKEMTFFFFTKGSY